MKLWAIARLIDEPGQKGSTIPAVGLYSNNYRLWSVDGLQWALCRFSVANTVAIEGDARIKLLPQAALDSAWSTMPSNIRDKIKAEMEGAGFDWQVSNNWTVRKVLRYLVNQMQPGIDPTKFDVRDTEG